MWNGTENVPGLCNCQRYQSRYGTCNLSGISSRARNRSRSHSPLRNSNKDSGSTSVLNGASHQGNRWEPQNLCYKKKYDELSKRHRKEKEVCMKEKEVLLKEISALKVTMLDYSSTCDNVKKTDAAKYYYYCSLLHEVSHFVRYEHNVIMVMHHPFLF